MQTRLASVSLGSARARGLGLSLSVLALCVQLLLPLIVALEVRVVEARNSGFDSYPICHAWPTPNVDASGKSGTSGSSGGQASACCPLCTALGAGAAFTAPVEPSVPLPRYSLGAPDLASSDTVVGYRTALQYEARGPPRNS
jgi:hypothetical protein